MRRECGAYPPLAVQTGRCRLAVEVFARTLRWFTPDVFTGYRQAQAQLAKVRRWQTEVNRHIRSLRLSRVSELAVARALKLIDARNNMRGLSPEAASFRKVALLWCGLTLLEDARNTCPLLARSGRIIAHSASPATVCGSRKHFAIITPLNRGPSQRPCTGRTGSPCVPLTARVKSSAGRPPSTCRAPCLASPLRSPTSMWRGCGISARKMSKRKVSATGPLLTTNSTLPGIYCTGNAALAGT